MNKYILTWDIDELAAALKIPVEEVIPYFSDGRRISFLLERRIASEIVSGTLSKSESSKYDIVDENGDRYEVRCITKGGIFFSPSFMIGSGRKFDRSLFLKKLDKIKGYLACDILRFPEVFIWFISSETVRKWYLNNRLGKNAKVSRAKILEMIKKLQLPQSSLF